MSYEGDLLYGFVGYCNTQPTSATLTVTDKITMHDGADENSGTLYITNQSGNLIKYHHFGYCTIDLTAIPADDSVELVSVADNDVECNAFQYTHNGHYHYYILNNVNNEWLRLSDTSYSLV